MASTSISNRYAKVRPGSTRNTCANFLSKTAGSIWKRNSRHKTSTAACGGTTIPHPRGNGAGHPPKTSGPAGGFLRSHLQPKGAKTPHFTTVVHLLLCVG